MTHAGQQEVNCGILSPVVTRLMNSLLSSRTVRSAVKDVSKTLSNPMALKGRGDLAGSGHPGLEAEHLADRHPDGRRHLGDDELLRVVDGLPYLVHLRLGRKGPGGADAGALAAIDALHLVKVFAEGRDHDGLCSPVGEIDGADGLHLGADADTVAAEHAFVRIPDEGR